MGGIGSGRRRGYAGRNAADGSRPLDIRKLHRAGLLMMGRWFRWQWMIGGNPVADIGVNVEVDTVVLAFRYRDRGNSEWQDARQSVQFHYAPCNYGGMRPWWNCPSCSRRVAVLYSPGKLYGCRHCHDLAYDSQRESAGDRALRRAQSIRKRLGGTANMTLPLPSKPKGMHSRTYVRLMAKHDHAYGLALVEMAKALGLKPRP